MKAGSLFQKDKIPCLSHTSPRNSEELQCQTVRFSGVETFEMKPVNKLRSNGTKYVIASSVSSSTLAKVYGSILFLFCSSQIEKSSLNSRFLVFLCSFYTTGCKKMSM